MAIVDHYEEIAHCNRCGFCQAACPIFRSTGHEGGVARGRLALLRALIENRIPWSAELEGPLYDCLLCGACTSNCFPAIPTSEIVVRARAEYLQKVGRKSIHRLLFEKLLPYPRRLHLAARTVALGKNSGMSRLAQALGLLRIFGRDFARAEAIVTRLPAQPLRARFKPGVYPGQGARGRVAYYIGCGVDIVTQEAGEATLALLRQGAREVHLLETNCCGLPAWSYGDLAAARSLAAQNLAHIGAGGVDAVEHQAPAAGVGVARLLEVRRPQDVGPGGREHRTHATDQAGEHDVVGQPQHARRHGHERAPKRAGRTGRRRK